MCLQCLWGFVIHVCVCVCVCTCGSARAWEFTNSTPRCLVGEVNTAEKMTESTRCLWNGARHGRRHKTHTRATKTLTRRKKRQEAKKKTNISEFKTNREPAQAHKHTHTRAHRQRWWTVKLQSPSISIFPIQLSCLALTLPERLDLMTCWEGERETRGREGGGKGEIEGRLRERKEKRKGGRKREREQGTDER